ncbi:MAG: hydrogenase maturation protease [Desulfobacteraceae bacterium]|nr:hydrogenase maturation protease [Desulfobacteraceae bacterium]
MPEAQNNDSGILIVGFGNTQRKDDGVGPYVVKKLSDMIKPLAGIRFMHVSQLTIEMVEDFYAADVLIFVDATVDRLENGWRCVKMMPDLSQANFQTHHLSPGFLLGLLQALYQHSPMAWLVAVQGEDFGFGHEITPDARTRAEGAMGKIIETVETIRKKE